jgi:proton-coupled amino acid transporter
LFKSFIGIGILATPSAIKQVGVFGGAIVIIICGVLNLYTMRLQIKCQEKLGDHITSYSELGQAILGARGKAFIDFCMVISQYGFCIAYLIFIGN